MPTYFYDFFDGQSWFDEDLGLEFESPEQAYVEAFEGARSMLPELIDSHRDVSACAFAVRAEEGEILFRLAFSELFDRPAPPGVRDLPGAAMARALEQTHRRVGVARTELRASFADVRRTLEEAQTLLTHLGTLERPKSARPARRTGGQ